MLVSRLDKLEEAVFNHVFKMSPRQAVMLGLHEYDGLLPDTSPGFIEDWTKKTVELLGRVRGESHGLDKDGKFDAMCLETMLERMLFDIQDLRGYSTRPTMYSMQLSVTPYLSREYAPIDTRIGAVNKHLGGIPTFLDQASRNLDKALAEPIVEVATRQIQGVLKDLDGNSAIEASKASGPVRDEFTRLKNDAAKAAADFIEELREEHSLTMDFSLGRERFQKLLWVNDRINRPVEEVLNMGLQDLESNLKAFRELAEKIGPGKPVTTVVDNVQQNHPSAGLLIDETAERLKELGAWLREHGLVSIPSGTRVRVVPTPLHMRATTTAAMSSPGPFEKEGLEGLYYVTPPDTCGTLRLVKNGCVI